MKKSKVMSASEAVKRYIHDGMAVSAGGFIHCISYALTHEIIKQKKVIFQYARLVLAY